MDGKFDSLSAAIGAIQAKIEHLFASTTEDKHEAISHRTEVRETLQSIDSRIGTIEHKIGDIYPTVQDLRTKDLKKQTIKEYQTWQIAAAGTILSTIGTIAYTVWKSRSGG